MDDGPEPTPYSADERLLADSLAAHHVELGPKLRSGGAADVYLARGVDGPVAVKVLRVREQHHRFDDEIAVLQALDHDNIVRIEASGRTAAGTPYLIMELVDGPDLAARLRDRARTVGETARLGAQLCAALAHGHHRGVVHRDVKPANILLTPDGTAKLADFGVARLLGDEAETSAGLVVGTGLYLAPEQVNGELVGPAADVYSVALALIECLTGEPAFDGDTAEALHARLVRRPEVPAGPLAEILTAMSSIRPADRPSAESAAAVLRSRAETLDVASFAVPIGDPAYDATVAEGPRTSIMPLSTSLPQPVGVPTPPSTTATAASVRVPAPSATPFAGLAAGVAARMPDRSEAVRWVRDRSRDARRLRANASSPAGLVVLAVLALLTLAVLLAVVGGNDPSSTELVAASDQVSAAADDLRDEITRDGDDALSAELQSSMTTSIDLIVIAAVEDPVASIGQIDGFDRQLIEFRSDGTISGDKTAALLERSGELRSALETNAAMNAPSSTTSATAVPVVEAPPVTAAPVVDTGEDKPAKEDKPKDDKGKKKKD